MNCDCVTRINEQLAEENMALNTSVLFDDKMQISVSLGIGTHWIDSSKKPRGKKLTTVMVSLCPFCGKSAEKE